jgi:hypothetical protein
LIWRRYLPRKVRRGARTLFVAKHNLMGLNGEELAKAWERVTTEYVLADNAAAMWTAVLTAHELLKMTQTVPALQGNLGHDQQNRARKDASEIDDALVIPVSPDMIEEGDMVEPDEDAPQPVIDTTQEDVARHLATIFVALFNHPESLLRVVYAVPTPSEETTEGPSSSTPTDEEGDEGEDGDDDEEDATPADSDSTVGGSKDDTDESDEGEDEDEGDDDSEDATNGSQDAADEPDDEPAQGGGTGSEDDEDDDADDDDEADGAGGSSHDEDDEPVEDEDDELTEDDLSDALAEAEAERDDDEALDGDVKAFQDVIDNRVSDLTPYSTHASTDLESAAAAHNLATELEQSFYASTMDSAPQWVEQQRRGVLNVMRYITRQPGDMEYFKQWTEDDAPAFNMAVSLLLDYSGSMGGYTEELAQAGYATKLACEKLGIPCTVVLWDTRAQVLWDANERAEYLPVINSAGGTNPAMALADLGNQRFEKAQHIVMIMTDGDWQDEANKPGFLASYNDVGRIFIGCGFNSGSGSAESLAEKLRRYGCDESYAIKKLIEIPALLEQSLVAVA